MLVEKRVRFQKYRNWVNAAIGGIYFFFNLMAKKNRSVEAVFLDFIKLSDYM